MIETPVENHTEHGRGDGASHGVAAIPITWTRTWLTTRWRAADALSSGSHAFRTLVFGSSISMMGTRISMLAFPMLVLGIKDSPLIAGIVSFAAIAPGVLLYMPVGAIVDRRDPRRVMLLSEISRGIVAFLVVAALLIFGRDINIIFLVLAMLAEEALEIFSTLADRRCLNRLIEPDKIRSRQASVEARTHAAVLVGRPIGPLLFTFGPFLPFLADAVSFIVSVFSLLSIGSTAEPHKAGWPTFKQLTSGIGEEVREGVGEVVSDRRLLLTSSLMAMTSVVSQALILIFLVEAHSHQLSTLAIGIVLGASGVGGAVGSLCSKAAGFLRSRSTEARLSNKALKVIRKRWLPIQMIAWVIVFLVLALTRGGSTTWSAVAMFVMSVTGAIGNIEYGTYLNAKIANDMIGKVSSVSHTMTIAACALGPVLGGYLIQEFSARKAIVILSCILGIMAATSLFVLEKPRNKASVKSIRAELASAAATETARPISVPSATASRSDAGIPLSRSVAIASGSNSRWPIISRPWSTVPKHMTTCGNAGADTARKRSHVPSRFRRADFRRVRRIPEESESIVSAGLDSFRVRSRESSWNVARTASHGALSMTSVNCGNAPASRATPPWNG
ncbi:MAG TPA: MFS transporter [Trebonia sp.]|nr:MFS transporter [Trebonia sp.]